MPDVTVCIECLHNSAVFKVALTDAYAVDAKQAFTCIIASKPTVHLNNQHIMQCIADIPPQCTRRSVLTAMCIALLMMGKTQQVKHCGRRYKTGTLCYDATCFLIHEALRELHSTLALY